MAGCFWTDLVKCTEDCAESAYAFGIIEINSGGVDNSAYFRLAPYEVDPDDDCNTIGEATPIESARITKVVLVAAVDSTVNNGCGWWGPNQAPGETPDSILVPWPLGLATFPGESPCLASVLRYKDDTIAEWAATDIALTRDTQYDEPASFYITALGESGTVQQLLALLEAPMGTGHDRGAALFVNIEDTATGLIYAGVGVYNSCF